MKDTTSKVIVGIIVGAIVIAGGYFMYAQSKKPSTLDGFAQCLGEKGATFYGAFWCKHCQNQKAMFGRSQRLLPYVECSTPDGKGQLQVCTDKNITGYPTWEFNASSTDRLGGEVPLAKLAEKTGCELPQ